MFSRALRRLFSIGALSPPPLSPRKLIFPKARLIPLSPPFLATRSLSFRDGQPRTPPLFYAVFPPTSGNSFSDLCVQARGFFFFAAEQSSSFLFPPVFIRPPPQTLFWIRRLFNPGMTLLRKTRIWVLWLLDHSPVTWPLFRSRVFFFFLHLFTCGTKKGLPWDSAAVFLGGARAHLSPRLLAASFTVFPFSFFPSFFFPFAKLQFFRPFVFFVFATKALRVTTNISPLTLFPHFPLGLFFFLFLALPNR